MRTELITSTNNEKIKQLKKLDKKSEREKTSLFLVENIKIIHDAIKAGITPESLYITQDLVSDRDPKIDMICQDLDLVFVIDKKVNKSFSSLSTPSGICAVFKKTNTELKPNSNTIYLNAINDPGNLGTILRTALAFGLENIVLDEYCVDIYNPKTISAAKDAIFKLNIAKDYNLELLNKIKEKTKVYSTNLEGGVDIKEVLTDKNICLVLGNEANGVSTNILEKSDKFIRVEMTDKIESLNVAITAGILFNQIYNS